MRRITRPDTYIPYDFSAQIEVMPSYKKIVTACAEMTDTALTWDEEEQSSSGSLVIKAIGSSPSDETVRVTSIYVEEISP